MTGPIKSNNANILVFGYDLSSKLFSSLVILMSTESVAEDHNPLDSVDIAAIQFAPHTISGFIDIK